MNVVNRLNCFLNLDVNKASGSGGTPTVLHSSTDALCAELSPVLPRLYRLSLKTWKTPRSFKLANIQPLSTKGKVSTNYIPVALTSIIYKIMKYALKNCLLTS